MFAARPLLQLSTLVSAILVQVACSYDVNAIPPDLGEVLVGEVARTTLVAEGRGIPGVLRSERVTNATVTIGEREDSSGGGTSESEWPVDFVPADVGEFCAYLYAGNDNPFEPGETAGIHYALVCGIGVLPPEPDPVVQLDVRWNDVVITDGGTADLPSSPADGQQALVLELENAGNQPVQVTALSIPVQTSVVANVTGGGPPFTLDPGAKQGVDLRYTPQLGPFRFSVVVDSSAEAGRVAVFDGFGTGGALTVDDLELGIQTTADTLRFDLILSNDGSAPLKVLELTPETEQGLDALTPVTALPLTIDPGLSTPFSFDAQFGGSVGPLLGSIRIDSTDSGGPVTVAVTGTVQAPPTAELCADGIDNDRNGSTDCADPVCADTSECDCTRESPRVHGTDRWAELLRTGLGANAGRADQFSFYVCDGDDVQVDTSGGLGSGTVSIANQAGTMVGSGPMTAGAGTASATGLPEGAYWVTLESDTCESIFVDGFETGHHVSWDAFSAAPDFSYSLPFSPVAPVHIDSNPPPQADCSLVFDLELGLGSANDFTLELFDGSGVAAAGSLHLGGGPGNRRGTSSSAHYLYDGAVTDSMTLALSDASGATSCSTVSIGYQFACTQDAVCAISCDFPGCGSDPNCTQPEDCSNGGDDDGDGDADCDDSDCLEECFCENSSGELPNGTEEMFFGDAAGFGGTYCLRDLCGNWLNGGEPILDESAVFSGSEFFGLTAPMAMHPTSMPVGIPVDVVGFLASDYWDPSSPNCAEADSFGTPTTQRVQMPEAASNGSRSLVFIDQLREAHSLETDCTAPIDGSASFRVVNLSPGVDSLTVTFESVDPPVAQEQVIAQDVPHGAASVYASLSAAELSSAGWASGIWRYYSGMEVVPYQEVHTTFGATDGSTAQAVHGNTCMSIIATEDPADSFDTGVLLVEEPAQCELWKNRRSVPLAQNPWVSGLACTF
ncbi:MAG: hypothetical protein KC912_23775 [Proteobacteria bacterium]|nr:hypothetical protein [Pseudomonadota bacterium]